LTWLRPSYGGVRPLILGLSAMVVAVGLCAFAVRRHPGDRGVITLLAVAAASGAVIALVARPTNIVPGLLVAFPLMVAGFVLVRRSQLTGLPAQLMFATSVVFALGVIATQWEKGGGGEWGGRYFALTLPVIVPVLLLALRDAGRSLAAPTLRVTVAALAVCTVAMTVMAIGAARNAHQYTAHLVSTIDRAGKSVSATDPVIVTTAPAAPRLAWNTFDHQRWLLATPGGLGDLRQRLAAAGVHRYVVVTDNLAGDQAGLAGAKVVSREGPADGSGYQVLSVEDR
jgi:hypothetical protein